MILVAAARGDIVGQTVTAAVPCTNRAALPPRPVFRPLALRREREAMKEPVSFHMSDPAS
jgi:hypothetical protein